MLKEDLSAYEAVKKAQEKVRAIPYHPYPDKPKNHMWNQRTYKRFMEECIASGETEEERALIQKGFCLAFMYNTNMFRGLRGGL